MTMETTNEATTEVVEGAEGSAVTETEGQTTSESGQEGAPEADPAPKEKELSFKDKLDKKFREREAKEAKEKKTQADATQKPKEETKTVSPGSPEADPATPAQKFTPNLKVKVRNQEIEVPKWMADGIKDEKTQREAHDLLTRAHGLEIVKQAFDQQTEAYEQVVERLSAYETVTGKLRQAYRRGDFDSFFSQMNIPVEKVLQWVADKVRYNELDPEQRQMIDARREAQQRAWQAEDELVGYRQSAIEEAVRARTLELDAELAKPEVKTVADAFDAKVGKPGAFRAEVINRAQLAAFTRKVDLTAADAVKEALTVYGQLVAATAQTPAPQGAAQPSAQQQASTQAAPAVTTVRKEPPVIPNISGKTQSPTAKPPVRSIEDLKRIAKSMA